MPGPIHRRIASIAVFLVGALGNGLPADAPATRQDSRDWDLTQQKAALEMELALARAKLEVYYAVIDLPAREIHLKCRARLLRTCPIKGYGHPSGADREARLLQLTDLIDPFTPEPGNLGLRLRGRRLPLDFYGRLIEGPRRASRLYFSPTLLVQSSHLPAPVSMHHILLDGNDIKALGSALGPGSPAIWIPDSGGQSGSAP
ncbi:MAG: hypothetical protein QGI83_19080 [Candidatus Latescibacteria bacterium]|jgi:hypothetical protein|nr:hypothetical protein [Candidatus Latescibacterota bacterium]